MPTGITRWGQGVSGTFTTPKTGNNNVPGTIYKSLRHAGVEVETVPYLSQHAGPFYDKFFALDGRAGCGADGGGIELMTPPLAGKALEDYLSSLGDLLKEYNFSQAESCGAHIHLDANKGFLLSKPYQDGANTCIANVPKVAALVRLYAIVEPWLKATLPEWRRASKWCDSIHDAVKSSNFKNILSTKDKSSQRRFLLASWRWGDVKSNGFNIYYALDTERGNNHHFEIRYHHGTNDMQHMIYWCALNAALVDFVDENFGRPQFERAMRIGEKLLWMQVPRYLHQEIKISKSIIKHFTKIISS